MAQKKPNILDIFKSNVAKTVSNVIKAFTPPKPKIVAPIPKNQILKPTPARSLPKITVKPTIKATPKISLKPVIKTVAKPKISTPTFKPNFTSVIKPKAAPKAKITIKPSFTPTKTNVTSATPKPQPTAVLKKQATVKKPTVLDVFKKAAKNSIVKAVSKTVGEVPLPLAPGNTFKVKDLNPNNFDTPIIGKIRKENVEKKKQDKAISDQSDTILKRHNVHTLPELMSDADMQKAGLSAREQAIVKESRTRKKQQAFDMVAASIGGEDNMIKKSAEQITKGAEKTGVDLLKPFYNTERLNVAPEAKQSVKQVIQENKGAIEKVVGQPLSHKEVVQHAQLAGDDIIRAIGRQKTSELGAAQLRLRQSIAEAADKGKVDKDFIERLVADKSFAQNNARLLGQRAINADPKSPQGKLMTKMVKNILDVSDDVDHIAAKAAHVNFDNPKEATAFYRSFIKPKAGEWVDKLRYNSMLSSPSTQITNIASNAQGTAVLTPVQKTVEGTLDALASAVTGKPRTRFAGEGAAYSKGYVKANKEAWKNFLDTLGGKKMVENPDLRGIPLSTGGKSRVAENILDSPSRALEAFDQLFKTLTTGGLKGAAAYRAKKLGTGGIAGDVEKEADKLLFRGNLTEKGGGVVSNAIGAGGEWVKQGARSSSPPVRWISKLTLPFINIGTNLAKSGAEYNPLLGSINMIGNKDKTAQASKIIIGGAVTAAGAAMALQDHLTFSEPTDQKKKNAFRAAGMQPYAIKIGDQWISYSKMHPAIAFQLAGVAALTQAYKEKRIGESTAGTIANGLWNGMKFFTDQTYMKNVGDFVNTMNGDVEGLSSLASNYPAQFIPFRATAGWMERMVDKYQRKPDTKANFVTQSLQQLMTQFPGAAGNVPARLGPDGKPIANQHPLINAFSPNRVTTENPQGRQTYDDLQKLSQLNKDWNDMKSTTSPIPSEGQIDPVADSLKHSNVSIRAKFLIDKLDKAKSNNEVGSILEYMTKKGILNDKTIDAIIQQKASQKATSKQTSLIRPFINTAYAEEAKRVDSVVPSTARGAAKKNIPLVASALKKEGIYDKETLAYALATIEHETAGTFQPIEEIGGRSQAKKLGYSGGENYYGRGFIQLTHDYNYLQMGKRIGMGDKLVKNPELAKRPEIAAKIMAAFFKDNGVSKFTRAGDFYHARGPVNGTDKAEEIAALAKKYEKNL